MSEKNLEIFHIKLFRKKSYLSTLNQNENFPNSNELFLHISLTTKIILYNSNAFTPCGIYAYIIARQQLDHEKSKLKQQFFFIQA